MELEKNPWNGHGTETKFNGIYENSMEWPSHGCAMELQQSSMEFEENSMEWPWN